MTERAGVTRSFVLLAALDLAAKAVSFAATVLMVRHYGEEGFGRIALAQTLVAFGLICAGGGLDVYAVRTVAADPRRLRAIATTVVMLRSLLSLAAWGALLASAGLVPAWRETAGLVGLFGLTLLTGALSLAWVPRATERFGVVGLAGLLQPVLFVGIWCIARPLRPGLWSVPAAAAASELMIAAGLLVWTRLRIGPLGPPLAWSASWRLLREAAPVGASQLLRGVALGSDLVLLGLLVNFEQVGLYAGAYRVFAFGLSLATAYFVVLLPRLSRAVAASRSAARLLPSSRAAIEQPGGWQMELRQSLRRTVPPALGATLAGLLLSGPVLVWLFGPAFAAAEGALRVLALAFLVFVLNGHTRTALLALGRQRRNLGHVAAGAVVHVLAKIVLIPLLGLTGAALGTLAGETVLLALGWMAVRAEGVNSSFRVRAFVSDYARHGRPSCQSSARRSHRAPRRVAAAVGGDSRSQRG